MNTDIYQSQNDMQLGVEYIVGGVSMHMLPLSFLVEETMGLGRITN